MMITMVCAIFDDDDDGLIFYIPVASVEGNKYVVETILQLWPFGDDDSEYLMFIVMMMTITLRALQWRER